MKLRDIMSLLEHQLCRCPFQCQGWSTLGILSIGVTLYPHVFGFEGELVVNGVGEQADDICLSLLVFKGWVEFVAGFDNPYIITVTKEWSFLYNAGVIDAALSTKEQHRALKSF